MIRKLAARVSDAKERSMAFLVAKRAWAVCERDSVCCDSRAMIEFFCWLNPRIIDDDGKVRRARIQRMKYEMWASCTLILVAFIG